MSDDASADVLRTRLCEEYGCEYPIVAFCHTREVVAAATNAGGIGVLGSTALQKEDLRRDVRWIRDQVGDMPFGIDTLLPASFQEGNVEDLEAMIPQEHRDFVDRLQRGNEIPEPPPPPALAAVARGGPAAAHARPHRGDDRGARADLRVRPREPRGDPRARTRSARRCGA